ncbi:transcription factor IIIB 60 kDa subunit isoform X1 [Ricinus communis]|uniref:transcription factor IIIB 60 kDa subunit isoform X1 n=1 Tax=Ricinus communis TaxID=3988 RepID=UPI00201A3F6B|nr:transcription factor IIIB 60 kDa subunit isoform X1 [Ricinus communis]
MVFCKSCARDVPGYRDSDGILSCGKCGRVLKFDNYSTEATFVKNASGQSQMAGRIVRSIEGGNSSRQRLYDKAYDDMIYIKNGLDMGENLAIVDQAMMYYRIAVERNFTKGRRTEQVQAACLYIACRENRKPYLLIDFSNFLRINIYVLGAVFLQLCKVLNLTEHSICQKLLDPSIFIHKYTASLSGGKNKDISDSALTIIASMNRDWMQTGRRPSGLWGAALYIAALSHGLTCSRKDILKLVHVCDATLSKRLVEFENTESGSLTIEEINAKAEELRESSTDQSNFVLKGSSSKELLCQHKGTSRIPYAYGLCKGCYEYFIGFDGGSDPPAFQQAEWRRKENLSAMNNNNDSNSFEKELNSQHADRDEQLLSKKAESTGEAALHLPADDGGYSKLHDDDDMSSKALDESDNFSDIDDAEVDGYLHNEEEAQFKKIIWEEMNREYLEEQAAKEAVAAAAKEAWEAKFKDCPEEMQAARELEAAVAAALAKSKKEKQQKRAAEAKNSVPAQSASEAARQMLTKKRLSSKINYDVLEKLFDEPGSKDPKKLRTESESDTDEKFPQTDDRNDDLGPGNKNEKEEDAEAYKYNNDQYDENVDEAYDYEYDFQEQDGYNYDDT